MKVCSSMRRRAGGCHGCSAGLQAQPLLSQPLEQWETRESSGPSNGETRESSGFSDGETRESSGPSDGETRESSGRVSLALECRFCTAYAAKGRCLK